MFKNNILITFRQLLRRKFYSAINILGLAISMAACLAIWMYVRFEMSYNNVHPNANRTYQVNTSFYSMNVNGFTAYDLGPGLKKSIPGIKEFVRMHWSDGLLTLKKGDESKTQSFSDMQFADSTIFDVFSFPSLAGNLATALNHPNSIVLSRETAERFFTNPLDAIGKVLELRCDWVSGQFTITAVLDELPANSTIQFSNLLSIDPLINSTFYRNDPRWDNFATFIQLDEKVALPTVTERLPPYIKEYMAGQTMTYQPEIIFYPILDLHLMDKDPKLGQDLSTINLFLLISCFILVIAWVNYVNLSTARAMERAREVGVKKAIGVMRRELVAQFFVESFVVNLLSAMLATFFLIGFMPLISALLEKKIVLSFTDPFLWSAVISLCLVGTALSGSYPAFVLSSFKTADVIKGSTGTVAGGLSIRKVLVVFQFAASLCLLIGTSAVVSQIVFMENHDKGLKTDQLLIVPAPDNPQKNPEDAMMSFKNEVLTLANVDHMSTSGVVPGGSYNAEVHMDIVGHDGGIQGSNVYVIFNDMDFPSTYNLSFLAGRNWDPLRASDMKSVLINEATIAPFNLGSASEALGERVAFGKDTLTIIGVVKNFYWESLKVAHRQLVLWPVKIYSRRCTIHLTGNVHSSIERIEKIFNAHFPGNSFRYYFLDDFYNRMYKDDIRFGQMVGVFSGLAMVIACIGLLGLATFTTRQRIKEISIRKVLGASVNNIVSLLSWQFVKLILFATVVAIPLSRWGVLQWLDNYPVKVPVSWVMFAIPCGLLLMIATGSIALQIVRGSNANPAQVLRSE